VLNRDDALPKRGDSAEPVLAPCRESNTVCPMLLLPAKLIIQHLFDPVEERITERERHREWAAPPPRAGGPARGGPGAHRPLHHDPQLL
jgi:hypothetical protein